MEGLCQKPAIVRANEEEHPPMRGQRNGTRQEAAPAADALTRPAGRCFASRAGARSYNGRRFSSHPQGTWRAGARSYGHSGYILCGNWCFTQWTRAYPGSLISITVN